ncbi:zinc finger matrin-type protein 5 isoform X2 [Pelobates fuscus]|uniref:zinc finger matrin-type protein 5 isoform X2 n=1 Tax=Pelobates fuscus TaxID=191477 RepID=UPI002FE4A58B
MGRRYLCDYCDRSFQDNLHNRKKHLNGVQHQRCKKAWYDLYRDASEILAEEQTKKLCRRFIQSGQCDFGPGCRFSHMSVQELDALKAHVEVLLCLNLPAIIYLLAGLHFVSCRHRFTPLHHPNGMSSRTWSGAETDHSAM